LMAPVGFALENEHGQLGFFPGAEFVDDLGSGERLVLWRVERDSSSALEGEELFYFSAWPIGSGILLSMPSLVSCEVTPILSLSWVAET
jgi:hypothetical protein